MKIDFINTGYRRYYAEHRQEILDTVDDCFKRGDFVLRQDVEQFEKNLCLFTGAKYAIGVNSGTDALKLSYKALGLERGDEVITVSHTFIAPIEEIVHLGGNPVLVDIGEDGLMDVSLIEKAITPKTVGIVPVHLSGKVCDMDAIQQIAHKHGLWVVEDACQALGAKLGGKRAGTFGDTGAFSFISPKTLGGAGDAGGIVTNSHYLFEKISLLRNHWNITQGALAKGTFKQPEVMGWGYNSRLDNIQAAILNVKWKYYKDMLERRREIGMMYNTGLRDLPVKLPLQQPEQIYQEYILEMKDEEERIKFCEYMKEKGVELLVRDLTPNHKLKGLGLEHFDLPVTERKAKLLVRLPTYPELTNEEVSNVIDTIKSYFVR